MSDKYKPLLPGSLRKTPSLQLPTEIDQLMADILDATKPLKKNPVLRCKTASALLKRYLP